MNPAENMERIIDGWGDIEATAELLADDSYWDGSNPERWRSANRFLYRTPNGAYWRCEVTPIDLKGAIELYEGPLTEHYIEYADAFPGVSVEDA